MAKKKKAAPAPVAPETPETPDLETPVEPTDEPVPDKVATSAPEPALQQDASADLVEAPALEPSVVEAPRPSVASDPWSSLSGFPMAPAPILPETNNLHGFNDPNAQDRLKR